jgi:hypothetical protein
MKSIATIFAVCILLSAQSFAKDQFISLFNGVDLDGWMIKKAPHDSKFTFWRVVDGAIEANSIGHKKHDYVWLASEKEYDDFVLKLKFQAFKKSPGNSGVQIRSRYDDADSWLDGPQIDIHPPGFWRCGMMWDETRENKRWLYPEIPKGTWVDSSMAVPNIQLFFSDDKSAWNDLEVSARGTKFKAVLNGVVIMKWDGGGVLDDDIHRKYNVGMKGHIALQIHKNDELKIRFKDIKIKTF